MSKRVMVTGATGFIGKHLVKALRREGYQVLALSRSGKNPIDITDSAALAQISGTFDCIFHVAAAIPPTNDPIYNDDCFLANVTGTKNILEFARLRGVKQVVYSSSISVLGKITVGKINETYVAQPVSYYGVTKKIGEELMAFYEQAYGITTAILRYPSVYGDGMHQSTVLPLLVNKFKHNEPVTIFGDGQRSQDFIHVDDVVQANLRSFAKRASGVYNIGTGKQVTMKALVAMLKKAYPKSSSIVTQNSDVVDDGQRVCFDYTKAKRTFGFTPRYSLAQVLKQHNI